MSVVKQQWDETLCIVLEGLCTRLFNDQTRTRDDGKGHLYSAFCKPNEFILCRTLPRLVSETKGQSYSADKTHFIQAMVNECEEQGGVLNALPLSVTVRLAGMI